MDCSLPGSSVHGDWDSPGKNTGVGCHFLLQGSFSTQGSNQGMLRLLHLEQILYRWASLVANMVKKLPAMPRTQVQSMGQDNPLEKGMATHSCILAWRIPWTEEPNRLQSIGSQRVGHD